MDKIRIIGGNPLKGKVKISGAKNATLPLMCTTILTDEPVILSNIPHLSDIATMANLLIQHGVEFQLDGCSDKDGHAGRVITLNGRNINNFEAPYEIVRKMRASALVLGPLLARFGEAKVSLPGGCAIGSRPIDQHLKALKLMGAEIEIEDGYINASVSGKLKGSDIQFDMVSVGATENILMAACLAEGTTNLYNAAREPEVTDLVNCLNKMGAKISGTGSDHLVIEGVDKLSGTEHQVISDRIEAGTYMVAAAVTKGEIEVEGIDVDIMQSTIEKLHEAGIETRIKDNSIIVNGNKTLKSVDITTQPHPGFPTDMQAQFMALMCYGDGTSVIHETIFENRFMHVPELMRMGADISLQGRSAIVKNSQELKGAELMATDLRASVSLIIASLAAKGESIINRVYHLDRGYERLEEKLALCGANIERVR